MSKVVVSAALILLNDRNEVLLVHRNARSRWFGDMHAFPGGVYEPSQDANVAVTAIRETFEETGILLAHPSASTSPRKAQTTPTPPGSSLPQSPPPPPPSQQQSFASFLTTHSLQPATHTLAPFTQWTVPDVIPTKYKSQAPGRAHTHFFVSFLPPGGDAPWAWLPFFAAGRGGRPHATGEGAALPLAGVDGEITSFGFIHPLHALQAYTAGKINLMPPQHYLLWTLARFLPPPSTASALAHIGVVGVERHPLAGRAAVMGLARSSFGQLTVKARVEHTDPRGRTLMTYEGDANRGGGVGRRHRCWVTHGQGGLIRDMEQECNLDLLTDLDHVVRAQKEEARRLSGAPETALVADVVERAKL